MSGSKLVGGEKSVPFSAPLIISIILSISWFIFLFAPPTTDYGWFSFFVFIGSSLFLGIVFLQIIPLGNVDTTSFHIESSFPSIFILASVLLSFIQPAPAGIAALILLTWREIKEQKRRKETELQRIEQERRREGQLRQRKLRELERKIQKWKEEGYNVEELERELMREKND